MRVLAALSVVLLMACGGEESEYEASFEAAEVGQVKQAVCPGTPGCANYPDVGTWCRAGGCSGGGYGGIVGYYTPGAPYGTPCGSGSVAYFNENCYTNGYQWNLIWNGTGDPPALNNVSCYGINNEAWGSEVYVPVPRCYAYWAGIQYHFARAGSTCVGMIACACPNSSFSYPGSC